MMSGVSLIIYDLDGTLYQETDHFIYYAELIRDGLPEKRRTDFWRDLERIWSNRHPLTIGRVYDANRDYVLSVDEQMRVVKAWTWSGEPLAAARVQATYPDSVVCRMEGPLIAVGDGWWIPVVCARRQGLSDTRQYYLRTKERLHDTPDWLRPIPGLADAIRNAGRSVPQIVATNSHQEDAEGLLERLGLADAVSGLYPSCNKPTAAENWFRRICVEWDVPPERALSVGDNYLNDIIPALRLGMRGLLIDGGNVSNDVATSSDRLARARSIAELIPWLELLGKGADRHDGTGA